MGDSSHIKKEDLILAQEMTDVSQVILRKIEYAARVGEEYQEGIEWTLTEVELYEKAKRIARNGKK